MLFAAATITVAHFTAPLQPWRSVDRHVALLRPAIARPSTSTAPLGSLMTPGWRLMWDGSAATPGAMVIRLALPVTPDDPTLGSATEVLQIGVSRDRATVRSCLRHGLAGPAARREPDRVIGGVRFAVTANGDAGMSQRIAATDLRAVVGGRCYAVARFSYGVAAGVAPPAGSLPQAQGAALLDQALASLRIAAGAAPLPSAPRVHAPPPSVAR